MKSLSCLVQIQHRFNSLTPTEQRIAAYISQNSEQVLTMPIDELAAAIGTAKSAVIHCLPWIISI